MFIRLPLLLSRNWWWISDTVALPAKASIFTWGKTHVKKPHTQCTCVTCSLPVKTGKVTCFYAAITSRRIDAIARNKARKLRVTSPAGCRPTYLQFAGKFTRVVIADCLLLQVIFFAVESIFACDSAGILACVCSYFWLRLVGIFTCNSSVFACQLHVFLPAKAVNFVC